VYSLSSESFIALFTININKNAKNSFARGKRSGKNPITALERGCCSYKRLEKKKIPENVAEKSVIWLKIINLSSRVFSFAKNCITK
jgi:hypothetical protein